jgi:UDP-N-acetylmuramate--alanine ligase
MYFGHIKNIHFVGIGGIGMSGIAEILSGVGFTVTGCDAAASPTTRRLEAAGISVSIGHSPAHPAGADLVVISSAVKRDHPELEEARRLRIPVIRRAEMLGEITRLKRGVAVAGTHGKTTTSAMIANVLAEGALDPTLIVGGMLRNFATNARLGSGEWLVVEADEYDRSFLTLHPEIAIITNIEADHLDIYTGIEDIRATFAEFANRVPFYGTVIACADDAHVVSLLDSLQKREIRYGLGASAELRAVEVSFEERGSRFTVTRGGARIGAIALQVPGEHNVRNALAAIAVGLELDLPFEAIARGLDRFTGVDRRFQLLGTFHGALVIDDYAHHPTEVRATLDAARRGYRNRRIVALFQPHLYSRTRDFQAEFAEALAIADLAFVAPIYPAREQPIEGVSSALITNAARARGLENVRALEGDLEALAAAIRAELRANDLFVTMGAGNVHEVGERLAAEEAA